MKIRVEASALIDLELPESLAEQLVCEAGQVAIAGDDEEGPAAAFAVALGFLLTNVTDRLHPQLTSVDWVNWSPICRECGCTDDEGCLLGCTWVERDLCSSCLLTHETAAP